MKLLTFASVALGLSATVDAKCSFSYKVDIQYSKCSEIQKAFGLTNQELKTMNPGIDCNFMLSTGTDICISEGPACSSTYKYDLSFNEGCEGVEKKFGLTHEQFLKLNPNVNCKFFLQSGQEICIAAVAPQPKPEPVPRPTTPVQSKPTPVSDESDEPVQSKPTPQLVLSPGCHFAYTVKPILHGNTCGSIEKDFGITRQNLIKMNPNLDCRSTIKSDEQICTGNSTPCSSVYKVGSNPFGSSCATIEEKLGVPSRQDLIRLNPNLDCRSAMKTGQEICITNVPCKSLFHYDTKFGIGCSAIENRFQITRDQLVRMNPSLKCQNPIEKGTPICVSR